MFKSLKFKKLTALVTTFLLTFSFITPINVSADTSKVFDLIEITDFHGALMDSSNNPVAGVLAKNINDIKASNPNRTLVIGGGDLYQGSPVSNVLFGVPVQKVMSSIGMEATALGNHEFDWTLDKIINTTMKDASYSIICSNVYKKSDGTRAFDPYKIITKDGVRIALVGAISTETPSIVLPANVENYKFTDPAAEINAAAKDIKDNNKADVIIAVIHEGSNYDLTTGPVFDIADKLVNVNAVLGGHSHTKVQATAANGIPVVIANNAGKGFIDLKMSVDSSNKVSFLNTSSSYTAIDTTAANGYKAANPVTDAGVMAIVKAANDEIGPVFNVKIGTADKNLTRTQHGTPYGESYLGNWTTDVIRQNAKADVAFQNNGGIRIDIPAGDITVGTIYYMIPFDNTVVTVNMNKAQLTKALEQAFAEGGKGIQMSGIKVKYDMSKPSGSRVVSLTRSDGTAISDTETLKVATNDFVGTGGDGFAEFIDPAVKSSFTDSHVLVRDILIDNVKANSGIITTMDSRIENSVKYISIIGTSDVHGNVYPIDYNTGKPYNQGLAKVSTYVNSVRKSNSNTMLVDSGDTIQGTPLSYYFDKIDTTSEYPLMKVMGAMGYDTWTLGNHEFNYGLDVLNRVIKDAKTEGIAVLSANTYNTTDNTNFVKPYIVKSFNINGKTIKVGILGLTTKCIPNWENTSNYSGLKFNDLVEEANKWVPILKNTEKADIVVATIHSGEEGATDTIPENQIKSVAQNVNGIDAIIAGHAHSLFAQHNYKNPSGKNVVVTEPGKWAQNVSQIDIAVNADGTIGTIASKTVPMDSTIAADQAILNLAQPYEDATLKYTQTILGQSTGEFTGANQTIKPTAIMDLINKVQMQGAGTQLSIAAPLSSSAYIPKGNVTIQDIMSVYVFENFLYGVKMTGAQLKAWMEWSVRYYKQVSNSSDAIVKDPVLNIPDYNLDQLYGATYDVDLTKPACTVDSTGKVISGDRIVNLKVNGKLVKDTDVFTVAINNYRFNGGGGFMKAAGLQNGDPSIVVFDSAKSLGDDGQVRNMMFKYIQDNKTISPTVADNWKLSTTAVTKEEQTPAADGNSTNTTGNGTSITTNTKGNLPKTGSMVDMNMLIDIGAAAAILGAVFIIWDREEKKKKKTA
ncbi:5'-nucleotidase C-terminal domain-containing protein [Clostridium sp. JN-9]|uniref:bifunctional metallophosphatase/5'-nucleotidase n=1 Tax=Clostridium sp. JN-9 TaxID=2507159 RepID=UPI000FFE1617|nr:5'-nucleotidase C-terminal domain-containing protein [Clostridium sp. JN-9]QAT40804.1 2',3'-cyclic-nucleotide 2'-phosphodiesterase [Clostridium sp. JN-9]